MDWYDWYDSYKSEKNVMLFMLVFSSMYRGSESFKDNSGWPVTRELLDIVAFYLWGHKTRSLLQWHWLICASLNNAHQMIVYKYS